MRPLCAIPGCERQTSAAKCKTCGPEHGLLYRDNLRNEKRAADLSALIAEKRGLPAEAMHEEYQPPVEQNLPAGRDFKDERNRKRIGFSPIRVAVFDIETTSLNAGFGRVLCACIKSFDPPEMKTFRADHYPEWQAGKRSNDFSLVADILAYLEDFDVLIAHNGVGFDLPFLRTRALMHGLPAVNPLKIVDPVMLARRTFRFPNNRLETITELLGTAARKTPVSAEHWQRVVGDGDSEALDYIVTHCQMDVESLEEVAFLMRKYVRGIDVLGSWRG